MDVSNKVLTQVRHIARRTSPTNETARKEQDVELVEWRGCDGGMAVFNGDGEAGCDVCQQAGEADNSNEQPHTEHFLTYLSSPPQFRTQCQGSEERTAAL